MLHKPTSLSRAERAFRVDILVKLSLAGWLILVTPISAFGDSYRCGRKVVRTGDTSKTLRQQCGAPHKQDSGYEVVWLNGGSQRIRVERWHYKRGQRSLERIVLVYRGEVIKIKMGER